MKGGVDNEYLMVSEKFGRILRGLLSKSQYYIAGWSFSRKGATFLEIP